MNIIPWLSPPTIINRQGVARFIKTYARADNWHELDLTIGNLGYGWVHYALIRTTGPSRVLCIGSKFGFVPAVCALACRDNGKGVVDFIDAGYDQKNPKHVNHWGGIGFWKHTNPQKHFAKFGLSNYIQTHVQTTETFVDVHNNKQWKYIHLDGDHSYEGVKKDYKLFWPRLEKGGYLLLHDIFSNEKTMKELGSFQYGVKRFWNELKKQHPGSLEIPGRYGLGIIQKHYH